MPDLDEVGVRVRVDPGTSNTILAEIRDNTKATTQALRDIASSNPALLQVTGGLDRLAAAAERATATVDQLAGAAARATTTLGSTAAATDLFGSRVNGLSGTLAKGSDALLGFFGTATKYGTAAFAGLAAAAGYFGVTAANSFEQTQVAFSTLLGSVSAGQDLFKQLQTFNLKTPFGLPELTRSEQTLLQYGVGKDQSTAVLKTLANVAAVGTDPVNDLQRSALALGQISSSGVVRGQDINQLTQAGFPIIRLLQQITGQTGAQLQTQIQGGGLTLPASQLVDAIAKGGGSILSPYEGAAEAQSKTLRGQFSNFKDTIRTDLADSSKPLGAQLLDTLPQLTTSIDKLLNVAGPPVFAFLGDLVKGFTGLLPVLEPVLTGLSSGLHELLTALGPGLDDLVPVGVALGAAFSVFFHDLAGQGPDISKLFVDLVALLPDMLRVLTDLLPVLDLFLRGLDGLLNFGPVNDLAGGLLLTLLGYKALSGVAGIINGVAGSLFNLGRAEIAAGEAGAAGGAGGLLRGKGGAALGVLGGAAGLGISAADANNNGANFGNLAGGAASGAAGGALIGSVVPGFGTAAGALVGGLVGFSTAGIGGVLHDINQPTEGNTPASQIYDPTRPGFGGYQASSRTTQGHTIQIDARGSSPSETEKAVANGIRLADQERLRRGGE
jgi:tape measure domain-containing protein